MGHPNSLRSILLKRIGSRALLYVILIAYAVLTIFPFLMSLISSFKSFDELYASALRLPSVWQWENYAMAWEAGEFAQYFQNSVFVTVISIVGLLVLGSMAAYALSRYEFRGRRIIQTYFLAGLVLPFRLAVIPVFILLRDLGLLDSLWGLILIYIAADLPFAIFILTNYFRTLPIEVEEAAVMDGAGPFRIYAQILVPMLRPALATVGVVVFIWVWNDTFVPLVFIQSSEKFTLMLGLTNFFGRYLRQWHYILAGSMITLMPVVICYLFASRQFIEGLTTGVRK